MARPLVRRLAGEMESRLQFHDADRGTEGWLLPDTTLAFLTARLIIEAGELMRAITDGERPGAVWVEAADLANFVAMVADRYAQDYEE